MLDGGDDAAVPDGDAIEAGQAPAAPLLSLVAVAKEFPGVRALAGVDFDLRRGKVHAVCGGNGAGKSTLMKIISGVHARSAGRIVYKGVERRFASPLEAGAAGIATIHQELDLVPHLTAAENIVLGREPRRGFLVDQRALRAGAGACLDRLGAAIDPGVLVRDLPVAQCQLVEIAEALSLEAELLIMDEPTSSLTEQEARQLFRMICDLKAAGVKGAEACYQSFLAADNRKAGELAAQALIARTGLEGKIAVMSYVAGTGSQIGRVDGFTGYVEARSRLRIVGPYYSQSRW